MKAKQRLKQLRGDRPWEHFIHHALIASILGLIVVVLETHGLLNWLDTASLRVALAIRPPIETTSGPADGAMSVKTVLISDTAFESAFYQESPLARPVLTDLLGQLTSRVPRVLAIDIDLSPGPRGARGNAGQAELDQWLIQTARKQQTALVLVTPFPVSDDVLLEEKYAWMRRLCDAGVHFAYPHIPVSQGLALRLSPTVPSLGLMARQVDSMPPVALEDEPCALVREGMDRAVFLSTLSDPGTITAASEVSKMIPLAPNAIDSAVAASILWHGDNAAALDAIRPGDRVLLGAAYDPRDVLLTLNGVQPGVIFHAATTQTLLAPARKIGHIGAFLFDFVLGIAAGYLFGWGWRRYNQSAARLKRAVGSPLGLYLSARFWLFLNFVMLVAWLLLLFSLSATLLRAQIWASPAAMIIGVFVKTLLASRLHVDSAAEHQPETRAMQAVMRISIAGDLLLASPLLIYGAYLTFFAHH